MLPDDPNFAHLWDMWRAACDITEFTADLSFLAFSEDKRTRFAVERQLMVIGEAATRVSRDLRDTQPEIPWSSIIGLRNVLAHEYGEVLVERIWIVVQQHVPLLIEHLEPHIPGSTDGDFK
jgi:uncharacterized protein with HEPN domain